MRKTVLLAAIALAVFTGGCDSASDDRGDFSGTVSGTPTFSFSGEIAGASASGLTLIDNTTAPTRVVTITVSPVSGSFPATAGRATLVDWRTSTGLDPVAFPVRSGDLTAVLSVSEGGSASSPFYYARSGQLNIESVTSSEISGTVSFTAASDFSSSARPVQVEATFRALR